MSALPAWSSLVELLHPDGAPRVVRVLGSRFSEGAALHARGCDEGAKRAGLVVIAPSRQEGMGPEWLAKATRTAGALLEDDGIVYALAERGWRRALVEGLAESGLEVELVYLHHPQWTDPELLIPVTYDAIAYAYSQLIHTNPVRRKAALAALAVPGAMAVARQLLPQTGLLARRPGSRPSLSWLPGGIGPGGRTVVQASWRGLAGAVLLHALNDDATPAAITKLWLTQRGQEACSRELAGLKLVAGTPAGARVPRLLCHGNLGDRPYLVEDAVHGQKAAAVLDREPGRLRPTLSALTDWLSQWNATTAKPRLLTQDDTQRFLLEPARALRAQLGLGEEYEARLQALGDELRGQAMPFVAAHGDLTMVNVLLGKRGELGVIDWEAAAEDDLPLADFFYAAVDAVAASLGYADRIAAWVTCFSPDGSHHHLIDRLQDLLVARLGLTHGAVALCFQATWLRHAVAEHRETAKAVPDEFLRIAQRAGMALLHPAQTEGTG